MRSYTYLLFGLFFLAVATLNARFHPDVIRKIDLTMAHAIHEKKIPGGILWIRHDLKSWQKAYGLRAIEPKAETATLGTIYDMASLTKVLATTPAILILAERNMLELNSSVSKYIPGFTGEGREAVTLKHLLTHTSGLRPGLSLRENWHGSTAAINLACHESLQQLPGKKFIYSDINFILLGDIVRRVSGKPLDEFANDEIYLPLKMRDTGFNPATSSQPRIAPTEKVNGQMLRGKVHDPTARRLGGVAGHAGVFSTAADLARFAGMILAEGQLDGVRILSKQSVQLMASVQTPAGMRDRRGLGWDIHTGYSSPRGNLSSNESFGHTGFTGPSLWIDPSTKSFWILLTNRVHPEGKGAVVPLRRTLGTLAVEAVANYRPKVLNGIDVLRRLNFDPLKNLRIGLITNHTGTDAMRNPTIDILHQSRKVNLLALFSPEHGIRGTQDAEISDSKDPATGIPVYSLYGKTKKPIKEQLTNLDALVFDIQDIGCRFYTYMATMGNCMETAADNRKKFFVLDRVNPLGGDIINGPLLADTPSFVRYHNIPVRHGMTAGELAQMYNKEKGWGANLTVIPLKGWRREMLQDATGLPWRNPSPNMRSLTEAVLYPGVGLLEFCKISVGRGTNTPFEIIGAPYINDLHLAQVLNAKNLSGITFLPIRFIPDASKFHGQECGGINLVITNRKEFNAVATGLQIAAILDELYPENFDLEKVNTLLGHPIILKEIQEGRPIEKILDRLGADEAKFRKRRREFLLYPETKMELKDLLKIRILGQEIP
jgi:uncharacterized protein YbbC (DUF1343 family)/CubicO group peptidase (beta-lactamase class C family)